MGAGGRECPQVPTRSTCALWVTGLLFHLVAVSYCNFIPSPSVGWVMPPSAADVVIAAVAIFTCLCLFEIAARCMIDRACSSHPLLSEPRYRQVLARHAMDCFGLGYISYMGLSMWNELSHTPSGAHGRVYIYIPRFAWTCVCMLAFQMKNLIDTCHYGDGPEFIAHHVVCIFVALGALHGTFLHLYGIFFFGISELSTALVSALACYDEKLGVPNLGDHFPLCKLLIGGSFSAAFVAIRACAWPYLAYHVVIDCRTVLTEGTAHSVPVVYAFLACLLGLTALQFFWLAEIVRRAPGEIRVALQASAESSSGSASGKIGAEAAKAHLKAS